MSSAKGTSSSSETLSFAIEDRIGDQYTLDYYRTTAGGADVRENRKLTDQLPAVRRVIADAFPRYPEAKIESIISDMAGRSVVVVTASSGDVAAVQILARAHLSGNGDPIPAIYYCYSVVTAQFRGRRLTAHSKSRIIEFENPGIVSGSTANAATYLINKWLAERHELVFYPSGVEVGAPIIRLSHRVSDLFSVCDAIDRRLVVTYPDSKSRNADPFEFFDQTLHLAPNQAVRFLLIRPSVHEAINGH